MSEEKKKLVSMKCLPRSNVFPYLFLQLKELQGQYIASDIVQHPNSNFKRLRKGSEKFEDLFVL